jgi:hypothetical protein
MLPFELVPTEGTPSEAKGVGSKPRLNEFTRKT